MSIKKKILDIVRNKIRFKHYRSQGDANAKLLSAILLSKESTWQEYHA